MRPRTVLNLSAVALLGLGISLASANDQSSQCIKLWSEHGATDLAMPYAATVQQSTKEVLTGTATHVLAYVERQDAREGTGIDPDPKQLFIFPTTGGRYVVRIRDLPPGVGLHGPF